jgi:hypothetical protein
MTVDTSKWSGEGEFTQILLHHLRRIPEIALVRVEDAPASRSDADYNFISNEFFVDFVTASRRERGKRWGFVPVTRTIETRSMTFSQLEAALAADGEIGAPDYSDEGMLQYLRSERIIPPYQTRGYKLVELVRIYDVAKGGR